MTAIITVALITVVITTIILTVVTILARQENTTTVEMLRNIVEMYTFKNLHNK